uniref:Galectin (Fragments) n=1 Tax=Sus scrofa domesticus TaxID=9825 RepID=Q7M2S1_PIG
DSNNLCLSFNPRFDMHGDINTIVCNSKGGAWGAEQRLNLEAIEYLAADGDFK